MRTILIQRDAQGIATLTLNRPDKLNAFTGRMMHEIISAFDETDARDDVRAVIVTGAGRAFCAGADLSAGAKTFDYDARAEDAAGDRLTSSPVRADGSIDYAHEAVRDGGGRCTLRIFESLKPVIGAINGPAVGIGVTMQLPMDIRIASTNARFGFVFARRGIVPEACSSWFLPRIVGPAQALEWVYSADILTAEQAREGRLVRSLHEPDELVPAAQELARSWVKGRSAAGVALNKQLIYRGLGSAKPLDAHLADSLAMYYSSIGDGKEGVAAFLEKRAPEFTAKASETPRIVAD